MARPQMKRSPAKAASRRPSALSRMRRICLALPQAVETLTWGKPHFRVQEKIFAGCGEEDGELQIGFKLEKSHAAAVVRRPGFRKAKYVGQHGWVSVQADTIEDWDEIREMIEESYQLIAPKRLGKTI